MKKASTILVFTTALILSGGCISTKTISGQMDGYNYVDLGLPSGTLWATCNVGASTPTEYGYYFAWGETEPKIEYSWKSYKFGYVDMTDSVYKVTKYCIESASGHVDNKAVLDLEDDAATVNWGKAWRMPTNAEVKELVAACDWKWVKDYKRSGIAGGLGTSKKNGNTIFFPAAGWIYDTTNIMINFSGSYWATAIADTSSLYGSTYGYDQYSLEPRFGEKKVLLVTLDRPVGQSVRAVTRK